MQFYVIYLLSRLNFKGNRMQKTAKERKGRWRTKKPILLAPNDEQHRRIRVASAISGKPMTHFIMDIVLVECEKIISEKLS